MTRATDVNAIIPEVWSTILQDNLYKSLVGFGMANIATRTPLGYGDVINKQYLASTTAAAYTPGSDMALDQLTWATDQLTIDRKYYVATYVDDIEAMQANIDTQKSFLEDATYQLKNIIDSEILWNVSAGTTAGGAQLNYGDTAVAASYHLNSCSAGTAEMVPIFANATKTLLGQNCENFGDWCAVITPRLASKLAQKSTGLGFNFADSALRNGYIGDFMGFQIYVSNNVLTTAATGGGPSGYFTSFTGLSDVCECYFGRKGMIDVVLQAAPRVEIKDNPTRVGKNILVWSLWGDTVYTRNKSRFLAAMISLTANSCV